MKKRFGKKALSFFVAMLMLLSVIPSFSFTTTAEENSADTSGLIWTEIASSNFADTYSSYTHTSNTDTSIGNANYRHVLTYDSDSDGTTDYLPSDSNTNSMKWTAVTWYGKDDSTSGIDKTILLNEVDEGISPKNGYIYLSGYTTDGGTTAASATPITGLSYFKIELTGKFTSTETCTSVSEIKNCFMKIDTGSTAFSDSSTTLLSSNGTWGGTALNGSTQVGTTNTANASSTSFSGFSGANDPPSSNEFTYTFIYDGKYITTYVTQGSTTYSLGSEVAANTSTSGITGIRFGDAYSSYLQNFCYETIKIYKGEEDETTAINNAIEAYETKMDGSTVYTNMQAAYDAYVACKQYLLTVDPENDPTVSTDPIYQKEAATLASNLTTAINNMEEFEKPTTLSDTSDAVTIGSTTIESKYYKNLLSTADNLETQLTSTIGIQDIWTNASSLGYSVNTTIKKYARYGIMTDDVTSSSTGKYLMVAVSNYPIVWLYDGSSTAYRAPVTLAGASFRNTGWAGHFVRSVYLASSSEKGTSSSPTAAYSGTVALEGVDDTSNNAWAFYQSGTNQVTGSGGVQIDNVVTGWYNSYTSGNSNVLISSRRLEEDSSYVGMDETQAQSWRYGSNTISATLSPSDNHNYYTYYYCGELAFGKSSSYNTKMTTMVNIPQRAYYLNWSSYQTILKNAVAAIADEDKYTKSTVDSLLSACDTITGTDYMKAFSFSTKQDEETACASIDTTLSTLDTNIGNVTTQIGKLETRTDVQTSIDTLKEAKAVVDEGIGDQTYSYKSWAAFMDKYNTMDSVYNSYRVSYDNWIYDASASQASTLSTYASELSTAHAALAGVADYTNYDTVRATCDTVDLSAYSDKGLATTMNTLGSSTDANTYDSTSTTGQAYCSDGSSDGSNVYKVEDNQTTVDDYTKALLTALNTPNTYNLTVNNVTNGTSVNDTENSKTGLTYGTVTELTVPNGTAAIKVTRENSYGTSSTYISIEDLTTYTVKVQSDTTVDFYITDTDTLSLEDKKVVTVYDLGGRPAVFYVDSGTTVTASDMTLTFSDGQTYTCPTAQYVTFSKFSCGTGTTTITEDTVIRAQGNKASDVLEYEVIDSTGYIALADGSTESNTAVAYKADDEITVTANGTTYAALGIKASTGTQYTVIAYADTSSSSALTFTFYGFPVDAFGGANNAVDLRFFTSDELAAMSCTSNNTTCTIKGTVTKLPISYGVGYGTASSPKNIYTMYCMMSTGYDNSTYPVVERGIVMSGSANTSDTLIKGGTGVATLKSSSDINSSMYMATVKTSSSTVYARSYVSYTVKWTGTDGETYDLPMVQYGDVQTLTAK